jgi:hypothetical protein
MRPALALWWLVLLLGVATYVRWYGVPFRPMPNDQPTEENGAPATAILTQQTQVWFLAEN